MLNFEEKFIVINRKHLEKITPYYRGLISLALNHVEENIPCHRYYVCNQDEPYADEVIRIILEGEEKKSA